jgi:hypothetical protein
MTHGHEKSDSAIVAAKPANKAVQPAVEQSAGEGAAAEPVEPRAGTKGNADQQSTCRTQSRVSVRHRRWSVYGKHPCCVAPGIRASKLVRGGRDHGESSEGAGCSEAGAVALGARPRRSAA